jgi:outer membrane protein assembly factor BamA
MLAWLIGILMVTGGSEVDFQESVQEKDSLQIEVTDSLDRVLQVDRVIIIGNKVTRNRIIERELSLKPGDTITRGQLPGILQWDKNKIYNLRLFNTVSVRALELTNDHIDLLVEVTERWYIFPVPIFELSDRNINEWWNNYNHDLSRVNYGIRINKNNFRGRNESLRLTAQFGFVRKFDLQYRIPNLDRKQKMGLTFSVDYGSPKNLAYKTLDHKLVFLQLKEVVRTTMGASIGYSYRRSFFETHSLGLSYRQSEIIDTVLYLNPIYYNKNKTTQKFFSIGYSFNSEHRDVILYPLKGYQFTASIARNGILANDDLNQWEINVTYANHWPLGNNFFLSNFSSGFISTRTNQPYNSFNALGYQNQLVRGYENYVIEGPAFALNKTTFKKKIFSKVWKLDAMPMEQFSYLPLAIYLKTFTDIGYVENYPYYDEKGLNQRFSNQFLFGAGGGFDVVTTYDLVLRFEYTFTPNQPTGAFFFNVKKEF